MQLVVDRLLFSASDLINYLECPHLTHLDLEVAFGRADIEKTRDDATELLSRKGEQHEADYLASLIADGREVVTIEEPLGDGGLDRAANDTLAAMRAGAEIIYQGVLFDGERWRGSADFLERVDKSSPLGNWSYEVADTKLARRVKPYFLIQACLYSELLTAAQGVEPDWMHVILGTRARESLRLGEFSAYYRSVKRQYTEFIDAGANGTYPDPVEHCEVCRWQEHCVGVRERDDHPSLVANMRRTQTARLAENGVFTVAELAFAGPDQRPTRIGQGAFDALRQQARLQVEQRTTGEYRYELLPPEPERGFERLPPPSPGDLFFDMEGDPYFEDGLEYLFGVTWVEDGERQFRAFWATDRAEEKRAFEAFMDFVFERLERYPDLHVYHYAAYEETALKRLMGLHATREDELDHLLRREILVDLFKVVRQGLRISQPNYSIKSLEPFYMGERETEIKQGGDSIVAFEEFLETGDRSLLEAIERYNEDDCDSTLLLRDWLLQRRDEAATQYAVDIPWKTPPAPRELDEEAQAETEMRRRRLLDGVPEDPGERDTHQASRWLLAQLLDYHRREAKPAWWEYFDRLEADDDQLIELDNEALGGLEPTGEPSRPLPPPKRSDVYTLRFPTQDHKIGPGDFVDPATGKGVTVQRVDDAEGIVEICRGQAQRDKPLPRALIPGGPYRTAEQRAGIGRFADDVIGRGLEADGPYRALRDVLARRLPRTTARPFGSALQGEGFDLAEAKAIAEGLDASYLFIQGPPGSGKTYNGAHLVLHLLGRGARVGVCAGSHAAIHNLLNEVENEAPADVTWRGLKKCGDDTETRFESKRGLVDNSDDNDDFVMSDHQLVAGTAWLFSRADMCQTLDYLVVDEAGQLSLADAIAIGTSAPNLILLGDPLQLAQVSQGTHPPGAGASVLEHLLGEDATIPQERGLFIDQTRRMHPDVCAFVSEAIYDGRLDSLAGCERQRIDAPGHLTGTGVRYVPVAHKGNTRSSVEEAAMIAWLAEDLIGSDYTNAEGVVVALPPEQIMVVAPYNAQVRCLRDAVPDGVRFGTVDKFQGQEAAVVFFSMATSSGAEIPRNVEFLFSRNRLNVAISRARCLAVLVCSPELLHIRCRNADQLRLANTLALLVEKAEMDSGVLARPRVD
jgi:predicted RecB family nuclease